MVTQKEYWTGRWDRGLDSWSSSMTGRTGHDAWMLEVFDLMGFDAIADGQTVVDVGCAAGNNLFIINHQRTIAYRGIDDHASPISLGISKATAESPASTWGFAQTSVIPPANWIILTWLLMEVSEADAKQILADAAAAATVGVILNYDRPLAPGPVKEDPPSQIKQDFGGWLVLPATFVAGRMAPLTLAPADRRILYQSSDAMNVREVWRV